MSPLDFAARLLALALVSSLSVSSWGRTATRNRTVGGGALSNHLGWLAADMVPDDWKSLPRVQAFAKRLGLEVIPEGDHWHIEPLPPAP